MSNIRTKFLGLAAVATAFAGISYGQSVACTNVTTSTTQAPNPSLRAESETDLVADVVATCTTPVAVTAPGTVYATLSLPVTSKALTAPGNGGNSEAVLQIISGGATTVYYGLVTGNQVSFNGVIFPAAFTLETSNIRVNASGGGAPQVTETVLISYPSSGNNTSNLPLTTQNVGYILTSIAPTTLLAGGTSSYNTCTGNVYSNTAGAGGATSSFTVVVKELFGGAFKTLAQEGGSYVAGSAGSATTATQILVTLANVPAASTVYLPQTITDTIAGPVTVLSVTLANSTAATAPTSIVAAATAPLVSFTPSNGTVTATYTVTTSVASAGAQTLNIPVYVNVPVNTAVQTGMTATAYYTPTGAVTGPATTIPTFVASSATPLVGSAITACQTSLLFPFVTNQLGFDTGIVLANTSVDNLGAAGKSLATSQAGTCTLSFYGAGAPTPATGVVDPQGSTAGGTTHAFLLSSVAPGFQGYAIASCPFLYGHGFAFIEYNLTQPNGVVEGYLPEVLGNRAATNVASEPVTF